MTDEKWMVQNTPNLIEVYIGSIFDQLIVIWIHLSGDFHAIHLIFVYVFQNPLYL